MIPKIEHASTAEIKVFQNNKLVELLQYLNTNSAFYQRKFKADNIDVSKYKRCFLYIYNINTLNIYNSRWILWFIVVCRIQCASIVLFI